MNQQILFIDNSNPIHSLVKSLLGEHPVCDLSQKNTKPGNHLMARQTPQSDGFCGVRLCASYVAREQ
jgi:hypothetical protein